MKYDNAESYDALVKRGLICEIMRLVIQAYDEEGRVVRSVEELPGQLLNTLGRQDGQRTGS